MRSDHLKRHMRIHDDSSIIDFPPCIAAEKKKPITPAYNVPTRSPTFVVVKRPVGSFHEGERETGPKNLQIQSLFGEIVNDDHDMDVAPTVMKQEPSTTTPQAIPKQFSIIPTKKSHTTPQTIPPLRKSFMPPMKVPQKKMLPPPEVIVAIFPCHR